MTTSKILGVGLVLAAALTGTTSCGSGAGPGTGPGTPTPDPPAGNVRILAWNDLGMHCYNPGFADIAVLPPYNNLRAQVIRVGNDPHVVTSGITVTYSFPDNTYSAKQPPNPATPDKTDFWSFVQPLFGANPAVNVGLAGNGLTGTMTLNGDVYEAVGIPLTEYNDTDAVPGVSRENWTRHPYQLATIVVKDTSTGAELARERVVAPVSTEMDCATCHSDNGEATTRAPAITPTGNVGRNILAKHDAMNPGVGPLLAQRPVLCAKCHSSNALNLPGQPGVKSLSNAMHGRHSLVDDITADTNGCYSCHPGPATKCLRDVMTVKGEVAGCTSCHGTLAQVAQNASPWLNEPRCDNAACHGTTRPDIRLDQPLYRNSRGHQNIYCAACHDSPHALAPSREPNDQIKFVDLQGDPGYIKTCTVCHSSRPNERFSHSPGD